MDQYLQRFQCNRCLTLTSSLTLEKITLTKNHKPDKKNFFNHNPDKKLKKTAVKIHNRYKNFFLNITLKKLNKPDKISLTLFNQILLWLSKHNIRL